MENEDGRLVKTWEVHAFDRDRGEFVSALNHSYDHTPEIDAETYPPAERADIRPTRRKKLERIGKQILVFADTQIGYRRVRDTRTDEEVLTPIHSEPMLNVINQINADLMPETTINLSDTVDLAEFSRFDPDSDHFHRTLAPGFQRAHNFYAQLHSDNPKGDRFEVDSNHTARVTKAMIKRMPELYGFTLPNEKYPLMSYYRLAALDGLVKFISGYGNAEYVHGKEYGKEPIVAKHGTFSSAVAGSTVRKELQQNPETHIIRGHGHSFEQISRTTRGGNQLRYIQLGAACLNSAIVPSYNSSVDDFGVPVKGRENWQNQLMMIEDFEDGTYNFNVIDVINGIARYMGKEYDGNTK